MALELVLYNLTQIKQKTQVQSRNVSLNLVQMEMT